MHCYETAPTLSSDFERVYAVDMVNGAINGPQPYQVTGLNASHQRSLPPVLPRHAPFAPSGHPSVDPDWYVAGRSAGSGSSGSFPDGSFYYRSLGHGARAGKIDMIDRLDNVAGGVYHHDGPYEMAGVPPPPPSLLPASASASASGPAPTSKTGPTPTHPAPTEDLAGTSIVGGGEGSRRKRRIFPWSRRSGTKRRFGSHN